MFGVHISNIQSQHRQIFCGPLAFNPPPGKSLKRKVIGAVQGEPEGPERVSGQILATLNQNQPC